jgi:hypothetical protein
MSILVVYMRNLSKIDCSIGNDEFGHIQASVQRSHTSDSEKSDRQAAPFFRAWCDVKWEIKIWLLDVPPMSPF